MLEQVGIRPLGRDSGNADGLVSFIAATLPGKMDTDDDDDDDFARSPAPRPTIVHLCGNLRLSTLSNGLSGCGFAVVDVEVYVTRTDGAALCDRLAAAVAPLHDRGHGDGADATGRSVVVLGFFSPSGVKTVFGDAVVARAVLQRRGHDVEGVAGVGVGGGAGVGVGGGAGVGVGGGCGAGVDSVSAAALAMCTFACVCIGPTTAGQVVTCLGSGAGGGGVADPGLGCASVLAPGAALSVVAAGTPDPAGVAAAVAATLRAMHGAAPTVM